MTSVSPRHAIAAAASLVALSLAAGCSKPQAKLCSTGIYCPAGSECAARQAVCIWDACGNGGLDPGEACDDGNKLDGDGCSADCTSTEVCGNGKTDKAKGEVCDDGNTESGDGCSGDCMSIEACGNGNVDDGEDCDEGPGAGPNLARETVFCTARCKWSVCGDGYTNRAAGEDCDGGDPASPGRRETADCNLDCSESVCGDGVTNVTAEEECDDGTARNRNDANCLPSCHFNVCGDGHKHATREQCDDGESNAEGGTDFSGACLPGCLKAKCGDGHIQSGVEACDTGPDSARTDNRCPYGQRSCTVCNACQDVAGTLTGYCGDGTRQDGYEACDEGSNATFVRHNGSTTCDYNVRDCTHCNTTCTAEDVVGHGPYCGDSIPNGTETCDEGSQNGKTYCLNGLECHQICNGGCGGYSYTAIRYCGDYSPDTGDGEQCDRFYSFQCGTCTLPGLGGCRNVAIAPSVGTLVIRATDLAGVTFTLDDGLRSSAARTFAFVEKEAAAGEVDIRDMTPAEIASSAAAAINGAGFGITATASGETVDLRNAAGGVQGNIAVLISPADTTALSATGMENGVGCSLWTGCSRNEDCVSGHCHDGSCRPPN